MYKFKYIYIYILYYIIYIYCVNGSQLVATAESPLLPQAPTRIFPPPAKVVARPGHARHGWKLPSKSTVPLTTLKYGFKL